MIHTRDLIKRYDKKPAVNGLNLDIEAGTFYGLLGPNGAGKTTTIKMLSTLLPPTSGDISIMNEAVKRGQKHIQAQLGVVPQHYSLQRELTVRETLIHHGMLQKMNRRDMKVRIKELLIFAKLDHDAHKLVSKLSGGNKRKLMIIRAVMHHPKILFLDEPTVGLDAAIRRSIWDLLKYLKSEGLTIILTTHYIEEARVLCDRIGMMTHGKIVKENTPEELLKDVQPYVVEVFDGQKTQYAYFHSREEATGYTEKQEDDVLLRRSNLEDVYVKYTKEKVDAP